MAHMVVAGLFRSVACVPDEYDKDQSGARRGSGRDLRHVSTAAGSSLTTTDEVMERIEKRLMAIPQLKHVQKVAGYGLLAGQGSSFGMLILKLKPWDERPDDADNVQSVIGQVYALTADIKDASVFAISPGMIPATVWVMRLSFTCRTRWAVISMSSSPLPSNIWER